MGADVVEFFRIQYYVQGEYILFGSVGLLVFHNWATGSFGPLYCSILHCNVIEATKHYVD